MNPPFLSFQYANKRINNRPRTQPPWFMSQWSL
jgi:hypothetical protein